LVITVLFMLPPASPINMATNFNYAPVAVAVVLLFAGGWWFASARNWFKGPRVQGSPAELAAIERELSDIGTAPARP